MSEYANMFAPKALPPRFKKVREPAAPSLRSRALLLPAPPPARPRLAFSRRRGPSRPCVGGYG